MIVGYRAATKLQHFRDTTGAKNIIVFGVHLKHYYLISDFHFPSCHDFRCLLINKIMMIYI